MLHVVFKVSSKTTYLWEQIYGKFSLFLFERLNVDICPTILDTSYIYR